MFCPGCKKKHLISLSVCPACGVMAGDSTWQKMESKISIVQIPKVQSNRSTHLAVQKPSSKIKLNPSPGPILGKTEIKTATSEIASKKTNRTLVEFQSKDGTMPEWRTQLKNAVRQRLMQKSIDADSPCVALPPENLPSSADSFFDAHEIIEINRPAVSGNEFLNNALKRIDASRDKYLIGAPPVSRGNGKPISAKDVPAIERSLKPDPKFEKSSLNFPPKPVYSPNLDLYDTSELDPKFEPARVSSSFQKQSPVSKTKNRNKQTIDAETTTVPTEELEQAVAFEDDRAPFAYRFNAGLFDILIASFASLFLLAPFMLLGGNWFTVAGLFGFLATSTLVSFIYLTTTIGLFGKSFGMHLFSIEMIDGQGEEYPSLHQAAVSSSVFLLSLFLCGTGFLTCLIDDEKRAIHDIVSNTLVVKEL